MALAKTVTGRVAASFCAAATAFAVHAAPFAYISNQGSNNVSVIDVASNTVVATVPVGSGPGGVAVNPGGTRAYVVNVGARNISVIDTGSNSVIATIGGGGTGPNAVALHPAGTFAYVTGYTADVLSVIDTASNTLVANVGVGSLPTSVAVNSAGTRVYVTNFGSNNVSVIDTASNTVVATVAIATIRPYAVAVNPAGTRVYVTHESSTTVSVIDASTNTAVGTIAVGTGVGTVALGTGTYGVAFNPAGTRAYVANNGSNDVTVINTATETAIANVTVGTGPWGVAVDPTGTFVYVGNQSSNDVSVISTASNTLFTAVAVGSLPRVLGMFIGGPLTGPPEAPRSVAARAGSGGQATVTFTPPASDGGAPITTYTAVSNPGGLTATGSASPITVSGLASGTPYTFTVTATNAAGTGPASSPSNSVTFLAVTNNLDSGTGSLRDAITFVNACTSNTSIEFAIPGPGPHRIRPLTPLPAITCSGVGIDGYTQAGAARNTDVTGANNAVIQVSLDGTLCSGCDGLRIQASNARVEGLAIYFFTGAGILQTSGSSTILGNYLGTDPGGNAAFGNAEGIRATAGHIELGGGAAGDRNLISNNSVGVAIETTATANISFNQVGSRRGGTAGNGNLGVGIHFDTARVSSSSVVGNFVRYNGAAGIVLNSGTTGRVTLLGNASFGNGGIGIDILEDGPTPNDEASLPYDQDVVQNFPVITSVTHSGGDTVVAGYLKSRGAVQSIELYHNSVKNLLTEGERLIDVFSVPLDANGMATFTRTISGFLADNVTAATTVDSCNDGCLRSSEYSPKVAAALAAPSAPAISLTPASLTFPARGISSTSPTQSVTLANTGSGALAISSMVGSGDFAFTSSCGTTVGPGATCIIDVTFTPRASGARAGSITITSNASGSPHAISLSGTGLASAAAVIDAPSSVDFAAQDVNTRSAAQAIAIVNAGNATLTLDPITIDGDFVLLPGVAAASTYQRCGASLLPGGVCAVEVQFAPSLPGLRTGFVHVTGNATNSPVLVRLVGIGIVALPPARSLAVDGALRFPDQAVGTSSTGRSVTLVNTTSSTVSITDLSVSGDFSVADTCTTIAPRLTCSPRVVFTPSAVGERAGTLTIRALTETAPYVVALSGLGVFNAVPQITLSLARLGFGNTLLGIPSTARVTLTNVGQVPVAIENFVASGDYLVSNTCGVSIAVAASCSIDVSFYPRHTGAQLGTLELRTNAAGSPHAVQLSGTGCALPSVGRARSGQLLCGP
jgi:YVTN family beta-propeller protein